MYVCMYVCMRVYVCVCKLFYICLSKSNSVAPHNIKLMNDELERIWKSSIVTPCRYYNIFLDILRRTMPFPSGRSMTTKIRNSDLLNTSPEHYRYSIPFISPRNNIHVFSEIRCFAARDDTFDDWALSFGLKQPNPPQKKCVH